MPSVTFPQAELQRQGPLVDVKFSISTELEKKYSEQKIELPPAIVGKALIDTGASISIVERTIPEKLGLKPVGVTKMMTASAKDVECYQYYMKLVMINLSPPAAAPHQELYFEGLFTAMPLEGQNISCLIGRDILQKGILIYIGYADQFTLSLL